MTENFSVQQLSISIITKKYKKYDERQFTSSYQKYNVLLPTNYRSSIMAIAYQRQTVNVVYFSCFEMQLFIFAIKYMKMQDFWFSTHSTSRQNNLENVAASTLNIISKQDYFGPPFRNSRCLCLNLIIRLLLAAYNIFETN